MRVNNDRGKLEKYIGRRLYVEICMSILNTIQFYPPSRCIISAHIQDILVNYKRDSPNAHRTKEQPALTVSCAPISLTPGSSVGLTSTKSMATKDPVS